MHGVSPNFFSLRKLYETHDQYMAQHPFACRESCSACCTRNVTLTTLEGWYILNQVPVEKRDKLLSKIRSSQSEKRYQPKLTANGFADLCMQGHDIPDEENDPSWGKCPLLENDRCLIYDTRPMGCRVMASKTRCDEAGAAVLEDLFITMGQVFHQYMEHFDPEGLYGNLTDILLFLEHQKSEHPFKETNGFPLLKNRIASFLLVPPEQRAAIRPVIDAIQKKLAEK